MTVQTELAALDGGPGTQADEGELIFGEDDGSRIWHFKHRWSQWGAVFSQSTDGAFTQLFGRSTQGPWWQDRHCTKCKIVQRRRVELPEDRTVQR